MSPARGRIVVTAAVVLRRSVFREADRLCHLYTRDFGKLRVRFASVNRPLGKLKALSEPVVSGEYRLHLREGAENALCIGGSLSSVHPGLRTDLEGLLRGLELCEMLDRLTPLRQPSEEKFSLIVDALEALERARGAPAGSWVSIAFGLRLLEAAGFGAFSLHVSQENRGLWKKLHAASWEEVAALGEDEDRRSRLEGYLQRSVERAIEAPLRAPRLRSMLTSTSLLPAGGDSRKEGSPNGTAGSPNAERPPAGRTLT